MTAALDIQNLDFTYGKKSVLTIKSLRIGRGETVLVYGDSGCGKSTLLNLASGILGGYSGSLAVLGQELSGLSARKKDAFRAENIAVIFQQFNLIGYLTVRENALLGAEISGRTVSTERLKQVLDHLQISELANEKAANLSHGQGQRVAAARAFLLGAPLILADEPTSALDDTNSKLFLELLFREARANNTTVIVVSHDLRHKKRFKRQIDLMRLNKQR